MACGNGFDLRGGEVCEGACEVEEEGDGFHGVWGLGCEDAES
jgi:hypothetical protein